MGVYNIKEIKYFFENKANIELLNKNDFDNLFFRWFYSSNNYCQLAQFLIDADIDFYQYLSRLRLSMFQTVDFKNKPILFTDKLEHISAYAFYLCSGLTSITIPDSVEEIESYAFCKCSTLEHITLPSNIIGISDNTFLKCIKLNNVTIPNIVWYIGDYAFSDCSNLSNIIIPDSVTRIGSYAFKGCINLTKIKLPDNLVDLGIDVFGNCLNLTNIEWRNKTYNSYLSFKRAFNKSK